MQARDVVEILELLEARGIDLWLIGGWGVDALLGEQTRQHSDLDMLAVLAQGAQLQALLREHGFRVTEGEPPTCFVMNDGKGLALDFHPIQFDEDGNAVYRMENGEDWVYPSSGLRGSGCIAGHPVRCVTAEMQVMDHQDYELKEKDFRDMEALRDRFGVELPAVLVRRRGE